MDAITTRKRISAPERRQTILVAARKLFAERGFEGAKTSRIAAAAGISEALLYRHFPSKEALYRSVLRHMVREQNRMYDTLGMPEPNTTSLILVIREFLGTSIATGTGELREGLRILLASLAGDGSYAGLVYRRAMRLQLLPLEGALAAAREAGDITGDPMTGENVAMFLEHIGTMISAMRSLPENLMPYRGTSEELLDQATMFCCRGIGLGEAAIRRALAADPTDAGRIRRPRPAPRRPVPPEPPTP